MTVPVLLVEDSRAMRDYVGSILESEGRYEVHEVDNGFEALRALPQGQYGLIVADINLPDVSGIELTRFVRQNARHTATPVIVISTDASKTDARRALDAGASAFLPKPFTPEQLLRVIDGVKSPAAAGDES